MMLFKLLFSILLLLGYSFTSAQPSDFFPVFSEPNKLLDKEGKIICQLPSNFKFVNDIDGLHDMGWVMGMPNLELGECGNIAAVNYIKNEIKLFDHRGKVVKDFYKFYHAVSPCYGGFHVAKFKKKGRYFNDERYHYLDINGDVIFNQQGFINASIFSEGMAAVQEEKKEWNFINDLGHNQNIIPVNLKKISHVSHFSNGLSKISCHGERYQRQSTKEIYYIDTEGQIKIDVASLFPAYKVKRASDFIDGIACIEFFDHDSTVVYSHGHVAYINTEGQILAHHDDIDGYRPHGGGFISYMRVIDKIYTPYLLSTSGVSIKLPNNTTRIYHISNHFFFISGKKENETFFKNVFDAKKGKVVYELPKGNVMGVKGHLLAFEELGTKRYYVINLDNNSIVYDTKIKDREIRGLNDFNGKLTDITRFVCTTEADLDRIPEMINLRKLTINGLGVAALPQLSNLKKIELLRIDDCRNLKTIPLYLQSLTQFSIRSCTSVTNLWQSIESKPNLKKLFIINMDVIQADKDKILQKYPDTYFYGNAKSADSFLEVVVPGF